ncbi:basic blue protein [Brachypodium distachyon]|uniref:Plantacyanin n=1 Tax=Brachypodium distachyon TaxID=15368 RepID=I1HZB3_BRADI|nr:basic blue protein [Brachypodium distachyon]KQJ94279.1 hypothetical protein BRADI_3g09640v3 [Brachypodium distachyon]|eukprot:XP_003572132.1 basic blue protein [Brachypodium distachyon]
MARQSTGSVVVNMLLLALCCATTSIVRGDGTEWIVGGNKGWTFGVAGWENDKHIQPGDKLVFKYERGKHNVAQVDVRGYMECKAPEGTKIYSSGKDTFEMPGGKAYWICTFPGHCEKGMRIGIPPR